MNRPRMAQNSIKTEKGTATTNTSAGLRLTCSMDGINVQASDRLRR